jgi:thiol-disulfide isomerase/thioredoxin
MTKLKVFLPILALIAILGGVAFWWHGKESESEESGPPVAIEVGSVLPEFSLLSFPDRKSTPISEFKQPLQLINFWATWCSSCVTELPSLLKLRQAYLDKGLDVIFLNVDDEPDQVLPGELPKFGITFPSFIDPYQKMGKFFDVHAIPKTLILNQERKILLVESGERDWDESEVHQWVDRELAKLK